MIMVQQYRMFWVILYQAVMSGLNLNKAFEFLLEGFAQEGGGHSLRPAIEVMKRSVANHQDLARAMAETGMFSREEIAMVHTGEQTGTLDETLRLIVQMNG